MTNENIARALKVLRSFNGAYDQYADEIERLQTYNTAQGTLLLSIQQENERLRIALSEAIEGAEEVGPEIVSAGVWSTDWLQKTRKLIGPSSGHEPGVQHSITCPHHPYQEMAQVRDCICELPQKSSTEPDTLVRWMSQDTWRCYCKPPGDINASNAGVCTDCGTLRPEKKSGE